MPQYKICFLGYKQLTSIAQQVVPTLPFDDCEIQIVDCLPDTLPEIVDGMMAKGTPNRTAYDMPEDAFGPFHRPFPERRPAHRAPHELYAGRALRKQRGEPPPAAEILRGRLADAHL